MTPSPASSSPAPPPPVSPVNGLIGSAPSRRTVLRGAAGAAVAVVAGSTLAGCAGSSRDERREAAEKLVEHARAAVRQQRAATSLAPRTTQYTAALQAVAEHRGQHAQKLRDEVNRLDASVAGGIDEPGTPPGSLETLRDEITASTRAAADAATVESGYVAGLLGSVSASCRTLVEVQLA